MVFLQCKVVFKIKADDLKNKTSNILFFFVRRYPSYVPILGLLTQFSGLTTLQSLVSGEALQWGLTRLGLVFEE